MGDIERERVVVFNRSEVMHGFRWSWLEDGNDNILIYINGYICKDMSTIETVLANVTKTTKWEI